MAKFSPFKAVLLLAIFSLMALPACSGTPTAASNDKQDPAEKAALPRPIGLQFPNLPFPAEHELDRERTFIYESGRGNVKVGGIHIIVPDAPAQVTRFYRTGMKDKDWRLIRQVSHEGTAMLYENSDMICTITLKPEEATTRVIIEIGPK